MSFIVPHYEPYAEGEEVIFDLGMVHKKEEKDARYSEFGYWLVFEDDEGNELAFEEAMKEEEEVKKLEEKELLQPLNRDFSITTLHTKEEGSEEKSSDAKETSKAGRKKKSLKKHANGGEVSETKDNKSSKRSEGKRKKKKKKEEHKKNSLLKFF